MPALAKFMAMPPPMVPQPSATAFLMGSYLVSGPTPRTLLA